MAQQGPPVTAELAASSFKWSEGEPDRFSFDVIIQVFEFFRNASSKEILNRPVMDRCIQHPRVEAAEHFPSPDFRSGLRDSLIERAGLSPEVADSVLNEIVAFTRRTSDFEDPEIGLLFQSLIFRVHKYITLGARTFRERRNSLLAARKPVDGSIELKLHKDCRVCSDPFDSEDEVILMPCRKHVLHPICAEEWCYQCPKCSFPFTNPSTERGDLSSNDGPHDDGSSGNEG